MASDQKSEHEDIERQLDRILSSADFQASDRLSDFLRYVVQETLAGRGRQIKGYTVATRVFDRPDDFDPVTDPIVRIQAGRLRRRLDAYYHNEGADDPVVISIPKGRYVAAFDAASPSEPLTTDTDPTNGRSSTNPRVAVLPFFVIGAGEDIQILADGISEELNVGFTRFMGLDVISRYTTRRYAGSKASIEEVARELGARFVVTGSVRRMAESVKVVAQLSDTESGRQLWAETFAREISTNGLYEIEEEITREVLSRIGDEVGAIPRQLALESITKRARDLSAYEATLLFYRYNSVNPNIHQQVRKALESTVLTDPDYAIAWALLAEFYVDSAQMSEQFEGPADPLKLAHRYAHHAINLDPMCQQAWASLAYVHFALGRYETCVEAAERTIELNPNSSFLVAHAAFWIGLSGQYKRGMELIDEAANLNPNQPGWLQLVALLYHLDRGEFQQALARAQRFRWPALAWDSILCAATGALCGEHDFAAASYREFTELFPEIKADPNGYMAAFVHNEEHLATLLGGLEKAKGLVLA